MSLPRTLSQPPGAVRGSRTGSSSPLLCPAMDLTELGLSAGSCSIPREVPDACSCGCPGATSLPCFWLGWWDGPWGAHGPGWAFPCLLPDSHSEAWRMDRASWSPPLAVKGDFFIAQVSIVDYCQDSNKFCLDRQHTCNFDLPLLSMNLFNAIFICLILMIQFWPFTYAMPIIRVLKYLTEWKGQKMPDRVICIKNINREDVF